MPKVCSKCKELKELSAFHKSKAKKGGLKYACKVCLNAANRAYAALHKEEKAAYQKKYSKTGAGKATIAKTGKKQRTKFPEKIEARQALRNAIRDGKITRPPVCSKCGKTCIAQGHHLCYRKEHWLDVVWLCRQCHVNMHKDLIYNINTWEYEMKIDVIKAGRWDVGVGLPQIEVKLGLQDLPCKLALRLVEVGSAEHIKKVVMNKVIADKPAKVAVKKKRTVKKKVK